MEATIAALLVSVEASNFHKDLADQLITATAIEHGLRQINDDARIQTWGKVLALWRSGARLAVSTT